MARMDRQSPKGADVSAGTPSAGKDSTTQPGQYGPDLAGGFGVPASSGAAGSTPASPEADSVNQAGQVPSTIFGVPTGLSGTGAPGSAGRSAGDGYAETPGARATDVGSAIYGQSVADHAFGADDVPRYNGNYPPEHGKQLPDLSMPEGTGAPGSAGEGGASGTSGGGGSAVRPAGKGGNFGVPHRSQGK